MQSGRPLKKFQMLGVEEQGVRRTLLYAGVAKDEDNNADGNFSTDWINAIRQVAQKVPDARRRGARREAYSFVRRNDERRRQQRRWDFLSGLL